MTINLVTSAIIAALSLGAISGVKDTASKAVVDAYEGLKGLIKKKHGEESEVVTAITRLEARPDSEGRRLTLNEELSSAGLNSDPQIVLAAQAILEMAGAGRRTQSAEGIAIAQADRGSSASVTMTSSPKLNVRIP